jgi:hypothetical protein
MRAYQKPTWDKRETLQAISAQVGCISPFFAECVVN